MTKNTNTDLLTLDMYNFWYTRIFTQRFIIISQSQKSFF